MSQEYWLCDDAGRVLGPLGLDAIKELAQRQKLGVITKGSSDGRGFHPIDELPELAAAVLAPAQKESLGKAQAQAAKQIRDWLASVADRTTHDVFRLPPSASRDACRAAFFTLVQRYVPNRLPQDATPELRLACEDAFLFLAERMVELEKASRAKAPTGAAPALAKSPDPKISWRGGMLHVVVTLARGDAHPFTSDPTASWRDDCLSLDWSEKVMLGTLAEVALSFEGHVKQIVSTGRVVGARTTQPKGFAVKLLDLNEEQRSMIRTWVVRADR